MKQAKAYNTAAGTEHGSVKSYFIGFLLSVILTVIPFAVVMKGDFSHIATISIVLIAAIVQILVHLVYFLHMNHKSGRGWNLFAFAFTLVILFIVIAGSVWIMHHLNVNMMGHL